MKTCTHCGGDLLRHAVKRNRDFSIKGVRYICRDCRKSFTHATTTDERRGLLYFNDTGRPTLNDWRTME